MPIKKASFKDLRQSKKRADRNRQAKAELEFMVSKFKKTLAANQFEEAKEWLLKATKKLDKAGGKGIIKKNAVARTKSRLAKRLNRLAKK